MLVHVSDAPDGKHGWSAEASVEGESEGAVLRDGCRKDLPSRHPCYLCWFTHLSSIIQPVLVVVLLSFVACPVITLCSCVQLDGSSHARA
mmetsp:Transcript_77191/g.226420  ORF Transcript_77191/g.226420 Transcript_77191/m.226420 type:complete len:90 (-) Transcript_77191:91-360(-)